MNNHLKLIIYLAMIVGIFLFVQDRFNLFDISWKGGEEVLFNKAPEENDQSAENTQENTEKYVELEIPNGLAVRVDVEIADDDAERSLGLSNRKYLGDYEGMLFVFDNEVNAPFWMKDMLIPLDILFIDSDGFIVYIAHNQQPCSTSSCPSISSDEPYQYVLEVNSGFTNQNDIEEGYRMVQYL